MTGTAPAALSAGSQVLVVQLGHAATAIYLGPVLIVSGAPDAALIDDTVAGLHFNRVAEDVTIAGAPGVTLAGTLRTPLEHGPGSLPVAMMWANIAKAKAGSRDRC